MNDDPLEDIAHSREPDGVAGEPDPGTAKVADDAGSDQLLDEFSEKLDAFRRLTSADPGAADEFLANLGGDFAAAETAIVAEMADRRVLAYPARFAAANRWVVKSVEVLYRNGRLRAPIQGWGIFRPVVQFLQVFVTSYITRSHVRKLLQTTLELYTARENQASKPSDDWYLLYTARRNLEKLDERYRGDRFGVPTFIAGGAAFAALAGGLSNLLETVLRRDLLLIGFAVFMLLLLAAIGSGIVQAAGVAKRRISMTTERPMAALFKVVGGAGQPPRDTSWAFALAAVVVLLVLWVIVPGAILGVFFN